MADHAVDDRRIAGGDLARDDAGAHHAERSVRVARLIGDDRDRSIVDLHRELPDDPRDRPDVVDRGSRARPDRLPHVFDLRTDADEADGFGLGCRVIR